MNPQNQERPSSSIIEVKMKFGVEAREVVDKKFFHPSQSPPLEPLESTPRQYVKPCLENSLLTKTTSYLVSERKKISGA